LPGELLTIDESIFSW
jgi:hypothetical protein